jgi:hypothetical protein
MMVYAAYDRVRLHHTTRRRPRQPVDHVRREAAALINHEYIVALPRKQPVRLSMDQRRRLDRNVL